MKKKILCTLLCVSMVLATIGCGAKEKETTSDNVVVETEENVENETSTNEEIEVENETSDIVVDAERPEGMIVGKTNYTDWGSYTVVDSANGLDNIEVEFYGQAFKATVPQDMGALSGGMNEKQIDILNNNQSKLLKAWFSLDMEDKAANEAMTEDEWRYFLTGSTYEDGYYFSKEWVNEDLLKVVFEANFKNGTETEMHGYAAFYVDYKNGGSFQCFYGEEISVYDANVAKIVIDSIEMMSIE